MATTPEMAFTVETTGPCRKKVTVTIPPELVSSEFDKTYQNLIKTVPIQGFRPGKAPRGLIEKRYGEQVTLEVKQSLLDSAYEKALKDNELAPLAAPEVEGVEDLEPKPKSELAFAFTVTVKPEFELPDIKGIEVSVPASDPTDKELDAAFRFNVTSAFAMTRLAVPKMVESTGSGSIINIGSVAGRENSAGFVAYGTAKAALAFMTRQLAQDFAPKVRVNAIAVGSIKTEALNTILNEDIEREMVKRTPMDRLGEVEDISACALYLASPAAGWVTGKLFEVDGGTEAPAISVPVPPL